MIDPRVRFGAPRSKGVPTWLVKERREQGEPPGSIAEDLDLTNEDVEAAIAFETALSGANRNAAFLCLALHCLDFDHLSVMPAKAGIQKTSKKLDSRFRGNGKRTVSI
ncbi:MAG: DUF433 domain-containing protein [Gammaproteobacteria bacterium]|nr:DUF433 domain-containing protein [Gammaproteobacteria bacterium]